MKSIFAISCLLGLALYSGTGRADEETKAPARPFLGVHVKPVSEEVRAQTSLGEGEGLMVDFLQPNSPAVAAGFKVYDILVNFEDQRLVSGDQLATLIRSTGCGKAVKMGILRNGKSQELSATLCEAPPVINQGVLAENSEDLAELLAKNPEVAKVFPDLLKRLSKHFPETVGKPHGSSPPSLAKSMNMSDSEGSVEIAAKDGGHKVLVKDSAGTMLYQGNLNTPEDRQKIPADILKRIECLEQKASAVELKSSAP